MMTKPPEKKSHWTVEKKINKAKLKQLASSLEQELTEVSRKSTDMQSFANYEPLLNAIHRAKYMEICEAEVIPGMRYWRFETDMQLFLSSMPSLSEFEFALECWQREE